MKILIIEDEKSLLNSITAYLENEEYVCETATDYEKAIQKIETYDYDCIVLDITLPGGSGLEILKELKKNAKIEGVLIISARNSTEDKVAGLKLGADDYLSKPFHLPELSARIAAIIRRRNFAGNNVVSFNEIEIDTAEKRVSVEGKHTELTKREYQILLYLVTNKRKVVSKNAIAQHLWLDENEGSIDFIYTHIKNLRKKLEDMGAPDYIRSVYGMGYKLTDR